MNLDVRGMFRTGLLAGVFVLYTVVVGMVELFTQRELIADWLTLGQVLLFAPPLIAGYLTAQRAFKRGSGRPVALLEGIGVGLVASLLTLALVGLASLVDMRAVLVNVSRPLIDILTFERESALAGAGQLAGLMAAAGFVGALFMLIPPTPRRALFNGIIWVLGVGAMSDLVNQMLQQVLERDTVRLLLQSGVLRPATAGGIFVLAVLISLLVAYRGAAVRARLQALPPSGQRNVRLISLGLLGAVLLSLPWLLGTYLSEVMTTVGLFVLMGLGLNMAVGLAGLLDLGYVSNFAVGAYVMGLLTSTGPLGFEARTGLGLPSFWLVLPVSVLCAMFTGFVLALPVLRMRGDYLAIATLGFGEIIRLLALSDWLKPLIGGAQGMLFIPQVTFFGLTLGGPQQLYYLVFAACLLVLFVSVRLNNSRTGRQWMALREDEDVAAAMGINTILTKIVAFTLSAASGGLAGAIFAAKLGAIFPHSFNLIISINVLSLIIVGGMGSIPGIVVGAIALVGLPELLREFSEFRLLIYGALLIVMMLVRPEGLWPSATIQRELQVEEAVAGD